MAEYLKKEGEFLVTIRGAHWTRLAEKDGDTHRMSAVLPGYVTIDGVEYVINAEQMFTRTLMNKGRNSGRTLAEVSMETLARLGMSVDANGLINPARLTPELEGKQARFVCEFETYNDVERLKVKFVNPPGREELPPDEAASIFASIVGTGPSPEARAARAAAKTAAPVAVRQTTEQAVASMDDIPF